MGIFTNKSLITGESVQYETKFHWTFYLNLNTLLSFGLYAYFHHKFTEFVVTNKRIIVKRGIFELQTFEMHLSRIETIKIEQSFWGQMFNFGNIMIIGTGGTKEVIEHIANPIQFRNTCLEYF